jgi:hypothetical protein
MQELAIKGEPFEEKIEKRNLRLKMETTVSVKWYVRVSRKEKGIPRLSPCGMQSVVPALLSLIADL